MKCFKQIKNKNKNKNAHNTTTTTTKNIIHQKIRHMDITTIFVFFSYSLFCSVPSSSPSFLRTHSYNLPFGILSYYTIFFYLLSFFFLFVVNFYFKKIIFLSSLNFVLCLLCVGFLVFLVFILFHTSSYSFFFTFFLFIFVGYFFLGLCCCCCWGLKEIYIIYISVLAASPDNLLLAFFFLFLYTIFIFHFMIFRMKQGIFNRRETQKSHT